MSTNIQALIPERGAEPFRVVYLLHGLHGDQGTWLDNTMLPVYAKEYNAAFIMPEAARSFYLNLKYGRKYTDYVSEELPRICQKVFNISSKREDTAVMGCSMGGYGALKLALSNPQQFGFCGAISPACLYFKPLLDKVRADPNDLLKNYPEGEELLTDLRITYGDSLEYRRDFDIVELVKDFPSNMPRPRIYATCGTEDSLRKENVLFSDEMKNTCFDFTYEEWAGNHEWYFFNEALKKTIEYWYNVKRNA